MSSARDREEQIRISQLGDSLPAANDAAPKSGDMNSGTDGRRRRMSNRLSLKKGTPKPDRHTAANDHGVPPKSALDLEREELRRLAERRPRSDGQGMD